MGRDRVNLEQKCFQMSLELFVIKMCKTTENIHLCSDHNQHATVRYYTYVTFMCTPNRP